MELENDTDTFTSSAPSKEDKAPYSGPENRMTQRRETVDRREMVRFELGKDQRRSGNDRRAPNSVWANRDI